MRPNSWRKYSLLFLAIFATSMLLSFNSVTTVNAQGLCNPDADVMTRAFCAVREAIETKFKVDLTYVREWQWVQTDFGPGIDWGCIDGIVSTEVRPIFQGWTFTITALTGRQFQARVAFNDLTAIAVCDKVVDTGTPAPTTGGTGQITPGGAAVGSFELGGHANGLEAAAVTNAQAAGMKWIKKQLRFSVGDGMGGATNLINDVKGKGFKILLGIVGLPAQMGDYNTYVTQYADFVKQVAALGPDAIEVWNEPNIDREWPTGTISGARYTQLLSAAFTAIKSVNPNIIVISAAPAPTGAEAAFPGAVVNDDNFMIQMRDAGAGTKMDCLGLHYNEGIVSPTQSSGDPRDSYPTRYYSTMLARGSGLFPGMPICWTELGYLSGEGMGAPIPSTFAWAGNVTVAQQAQWLAEAATLAAQSGKVRLMIVWNLNFTIWGSDPMGGYAMMRPNGTCPACTALGTVMKK
jgi:hypothetical protein